MNSFPKPVSISLAWRGKMRLLTVAIALLAMAACDGFGTLTVEEHLERAKALQLSGDLRASILELKSALQQDPNSLAARLSLGSVYVLVGDSPAAEKELRRALELGAHQAAVYPNLGQALIDQGKFRDAIDGLTFTAADDPVFRSAVLNIHGGAYYGLRQFDKAEEAFRAAGELDPKNPAPLIGLARIALDGKDDKAVDELLAKATAIAADNYAVRTLAGDVLFRRGDYAAAQATFAALYKDNPFRAQTRLSLALADIATGKNDEAITILDTLLEIAPNHPYSNYLRALAAYQVKDYDTAKTTAEKVLAAEPGHVPSLLIAGAAAFARGDNEQAAGHLKRFLNVLPGNARARRLLGATQIRLGQPAEAVKTLGPLADAAPDDADLLTAVGTAAIQAGDLSSANRYLSAAVSARPDDARRRAQLGTLKAISGDLEAGLKDLEEAIKMDPGLQQAEATYINILLRAKEYERALEAARRLVRAQPDEAAPRILEGMALLGGGDKTAAGAAFEAALKLDPKSFTATNQLALMAALDGKADEARDRYRALLAASPDNLAGIIQLAKLEANQKNHGRVVELLEKARDLQPNSVQVVVNLARAYLQVRDTDKAITLLTPARQKFGEIPALLEALGYAQIFASRATEAVTTFEALTKAQPQAAGAWRLLAQAQLAAGDRNAALASTKEALKRDPKNLAVGTLRARLLLQEKKIDDATALIEKLQVDYPQSPGLMDLQAGIASLGGDEARAVRLLEIAQETRPTGARTRLLASGYWRRGEKDKSLALLGKWTAQYPADYGTRIDYANYLLASDKMQKARAELESIDTAQPGNWIVENDLAWVLYRQGEYRKARVLAEKAYNSQPANVGVGDTFGVILAEVGEVERAERLLRQAHEAVPDDRAIGFHLAKVLAKTGNADEARKILGTVLDGGAPFSERAEAEKLLASLGG